jgi:hypothetical protein
MLISSWACRNIECVMHGSTRSGWIQCGVRLPVLRSHRDAAHGTRADAPYASARADHTRRGVCPPTIAYNTYAGPSAHADRQKHKPARAAQAHALRRPSGRMFIRVQALFSLSQPARTPRAERRSPLHPWRASGSISARAVLRPRWAGSTRRAHRHPPARRTARA